MPPSSFSTQRDATGLFGDVHAFLGRFVAYPSEHAHVAHTLWIGHTHLMDAWETTPRLAFLSPEPASGKTRGLEATEPLVPKPVEAINVTPAYLFRKVGESKELPTVLFDEIDTVFGPKAKDNEEIRGLLNAGHRRGAVAGRAVVKGKRVETEEIPAYCAVALAGIGALPDTILSRCIVIRMRRRAPGETVEPFRRRIHAPEGQALRDRLATWARYTLPLVTNAWPDLPQGVEDRDADVWEPLLAVADAVAGDWPHRARVAAVALVAESKDSTPSLGIRLLSDLRTIMNGEDQLPTESILQRLTGREPYTHIEDQPVHLDEAPWADIYGKPLNARSLAMRLREYGVKSKNIRTEGKVTKGYTAEDLHDPWERYLPALGLPPHERATTATCATATPA